jgi:hypothetical protein
MASEEVGTSDFSAQRRSDRDAFHSLAGYLQ